MGRSMSLPNTPSQLALVPHAATVYAKDVNRYFQVFRQGSDLYQSEYALDPSGHEVYRRTEKLAYGVGSGANGFSYIIRRGNYLFQAPLSYYSKPGVWDLSPGYELGFNRPIDSSCTACHSGRPEPIPNRDPLYHDPPFKELAIGCENCHGPGQLHVEERLKGAALAPGHADPSVVNPARLTPWLADNICMSCHEQGDAQALLPGKNYQDFRPGTPLNQTLALFKLPMKPGAAEQSPFLNHYTLMVLSQCFRQSNGRLGCTTCHDPHVQPSAEAAPAYYRAKCLSCHTEASCKVALRKRLGRTPPDDCAGCHMPKNPLTEISHAALTNHRIIARAGEPYPKGALQRETPGLPGLIYLNATPGATRLDLPPLAELVAYRQVIDAGPVYRQQFLSLLDQVAAKEADNQLVLAILARRTLQQSRGHDVSAVIRDLSTAIERGSTWAPDYVLLADLLARSGQPDRAVRVAERGLALDPYTPALYAVLGQCYEAAGDPQKARATWQEGLRLFPEDGPLRELLARR